MAKKTYQVTLEITVETNYPQDDISFSRYLEDGEVTIFPKHEEDSIIECYETNKKLVRQVK